LLSEIEIELALKYFKNKFRKTSYISVNAETFFRKKFSALKNFFGKFRNFSEIIFLRETEIF